MSYWKSIFIRDADNPDQIAKVDEFGRLLVTSTPQNELPKVFQDHVQKILPTTKASALTLLSVSGKGRVSFMAIQVDDKNINIIFEVDGVEVYDLWLSDLKDSKMGDGIIRFPTEYNDADKMFKDDYSGEPFAFGTSMSIKAYSPGAKKLNHVFVRYGLQ